MENYYNIHNIVKIKIQTKKLDIVKDYEYYFRDFKVVEKINNVDIEIRDIDEFSLPKESFNISNAFFGFDHGVYSKNDSYAVRIENNKMVIFLRESNLCINSLIEYFLLRNDCTFIHGAGISYKNKGIIFPAPPNTGKTLLISKLRQKENVNFFGDDYVILKKDGTMYSYPMDFSVYDYHFDFFPELKGTIENKKIKRNIYERALVNMVKDLPIKKVLKRMARFIGYDFLQGGLYLKIPAQQLVAKEKIGVSTQIKYCIFLSRYNGKEFKVEKIKLENLVKETLGILQSEWYKTLPVYNLLSSFGIIDFSEYLNSIKNIISSGFSDMELFKILIPTDMENKERLQKIEKFLEQNVFNPE